MAESLTSAAAWWISFLSPVDRTRLVVSPVFSLCAKLNQEAAVQDSKSLLSSSDIMSNKGSKCISQNMKLDLSRT